MNQQQKYILNLQRKSRERKREQAFVIEGRKMFEEAPADRVKMIVASESFCKSKEGAALLKEKKFDVVSDSIFETLSDTKTPQGILAVVKQQPYSFEELLGKEEVERRRKAKEDEMFENLFGQWDEDFMDLQEPENEEPAVVVPQKQPMAGMANIFSLFDF